MTIGSQLRSAGPFTGTGVNTVFPFAFKVFTTADILLAKTDTGLVQTTPALGTDYTVTLNTDQNVQPGGYVTLLMALPAAYTLTITSNVALLQPLSLTNSGGFFPKNIEDEFDRLTVLLQQLNFNGAQTLRVPEIGGVGPLPAGSVRANNVLGFDSLGNPVAVAPASGSAAALATDLTNSVVAAKGAGQIGFGYGLSYAASTIGNWIQGLANSAGASFIGWIHAGTGAGLRALHLRLRDRISPLDYQCVGDGVADDTANFALCMAQVPAYGTLDLLGKTYSITAPPARPAVGVMVRNGRIKLNNPTAVYLYGLVANDNCVFDSIYFLGSGAIGTTAGVAFTASVGNAVAGTLTVGITNGNYIFWFSDGSVRYVTVAGGTAVTWTGALSNTVTTTASYPLAARYQGGIFGGNTGYPAPMNTAPANYVTVRGCTFDSLTVGVWSGGATGDAVPTGWHAVDNTIVNAVGVPSLSEGYGILFTPSNNGVIRGNTFKTIRRHAIYLAGEASNNVVVDNVVDGVDNIAIQSNTAVAQNYADGNVISNNTLRNFTRSVPYGYRSSIGIGLYGKVKNAVVTGNKIFGPLDTGIDTSGELAGAPYSDRLVIGPNQIIMDPAATDAGIRLDGLQSGKVCGNNILLQNSNYGIVATSAVGSSAQVLDVTDNTIETTNPAATGFRVALAAGRVLRVFRNTLNGFTYANGISDTSSAGTVRTDLNRRTGFFGSDAGFTHNSGGTIANTDCPTVRHAGTLTAVRTITLTETNVDAGGTFTLMRPGGGAFALNVNTGVSLVKAVSTGQWASFAYNASGNWEETGFGTL
jgi:hypothetical protein